MRGARHLRPPNSKPFVGAKRSQYFAGKLPHMDHGQSAAKFYLCPMHPDVRQATSGKCPACGMDLLPEGTRFAMLRHMIKSPLMIIVMVAAMAAMVAVMMMR